jgi:5'-deoxynucleotidase YfbR-like HD superfamily hydrolase
MGQVERLHAVAYEPVSEFDAGAFQADAALDQIDRIITDIYLPFRGQTGYGTERAIFIEPPHAGHRENDAEHSWHLGLTAQVLWDNREALGLVFPDDYDPLRATQFAQVHDVIELWAPDVDAMTPHVDRIDNKKSSEWAARKLMRSQAPYLAGVAEVWEEYEHKDSPEARFVSDLDKIISTRIIYLDGGRKWHDWEGYSTSRETMCERQRGKLLTPVGHAIFDALERDLDNHPEYFPEPAATDTQGRLF